jgi:hypothetical protein
MELVFGVVDIPYTDQDEGPKKVPKPRKGKANKPLKSRPAGSDSGTTTGDVAMILEAKYHIMRIFSEDFHEVIVNELAIALQGSIVNLMLGGPVVDDMNPYEDALEIIKQRFEFFLDSEEMGKLGYPGVPTQAALKGVNHRLKLKKGDRRPSFIDTGLYQKSFKAWIE